VIDQRARLDRAATRAEVAAIFTSAFRVNTADLQIDTRYKDVSGTTAFSTSIEALSRDAVISGDTDIEGKATGTFRPTDNINRAEVAKIVIQARTKYGTPGKGRIPSEEQGGTENEENIVTYTKDGFSPMILRIKKGETVTFKNTGTTGLWVASNPHPTHTMLPGLDANRTLINGETYIYTFTQIGSWGFHNHLGSQFQGTIVVE
jgi:plastocyanin